MELILVGVDNTPASRRAVGWSADMARALSARVLAVHVVPGILEWELAALQVDADRVVRRRRSQLVGAWTEPLRTSQVSYSTRFVRGDPAKQLLRIADQEDADLIVIGAKSHRWAHEAFLGGTAPGLANRASRPLVLIHDGAGT